MGIVGVCSRNCAFTAVRNKTRSAFTSLSMLLVTISGPEEKQGGGGLTGIHRCRGGR